MFCLHFENLFVFRIGVPNPAWSTFELVSTPNVQPTVLPKSTIILDKDHGKLHYSFILHTFCVLSTDDLLIP